MERLERLEQAELRWCWASAYESGAGDQAELVGLSRKIFKRRMAMTAAEKILAEKNLDLIFDFEKYVLEHGPGVRIQFIDFIARVAWAWHKNLINDSTAKRTKTICGLVAALL